MEELGGVLSILGRLIGLLARVLLWLFWEFGYETLAWYLGWLLCRSVSFGRYPSVAIYEYERASANEAIWVPVVGLVFLFILAVALW